MSEKERARIAATETWNVAEPESNYLGALLRERNERGS
jgi:hypothetical protein